MCRRDHGAKGWMNECGWGGYLHVLIALRLVRISMTEVFSSIKSEFLIDPCFSFLYFTLIAKNRFKKINDIFHLKLQINILYYSIAKDVIS